MNSQHQKMWWSVVALVFVSSLSGCAAWPTVKPDQYLKPNEAASSPCITTDYLTARNCALLTINEISTLLANSGEFDRGMAYTALGLGTITGGVLAHQGSESVLKGLAVVSGGLLGLTSVTNTKQQRAILEKALREMTCSVRATDALQASSIQLKVADTSFLNLNAVPPISITSADAKMSALHAANNFSALGEGPKALMISARTKEAIHLEVLSRSVISSYRALSSAQTSAATKLSSAVIDIRADVRVGLANLNPSAEDLIKTQSNRIVDITGEVVRKRSDLEKKQTEQSSGDDEEARKTIRASQEFVTNTAAIAAVFRNCVDPATQREIEK